MSLRDLVDEPLILLDLPKSRDYFLSIFSDRDLEPKIAHRTSSYEMVRGLVASAINNGQSGRLLGGHSPASAIDLGQELFGQAPTLIRRKLARGIQDIL